MDLNKKDASIVIRLNEHDKQKLLAIANTKRLGLSTYIRTVLLSNI